MQKIFPTNKAAFSLDFNFASAMPQRVKIQAFDKNKPYSVYYDTSADINSNGRLFNLTFPMSPDELVIRVYPSRFRTYNDFLQHGNPVQKEITGKYKVGALKTFPIWLSPGDLEFIRFAKWYALNASILSGTQANGIPSIYKSDNGKFEFHVHSGRIYDQTSKGYVSTPARVGHTSGIIEISKAQFLTYTIPGRIAILLHEYAHKYINQREGLKMEDEIGADINALNIYLSLGFSPLEAMLVFLKVFETANNTFNQRRCLVLNDFITKFMNGQLQDFYKSNKK